MKNFNIPTKEEVSANNQAIFDNLNKGLGFVPNLYAAMAHSDSALESYLAFQGSKTSLSNKEKEVVNLIVSQVNGCAYCLSAHTTLGKMNGFTEDETIELRTGSFDADEKLDALAKLTKEISETKGKANETVVNEFYEAGYNKGTLVDVIKLIGDKTVMNYLHNLTQIAIDFPIAKELETV
ncbi:MAG: carboxymuconolactone decarboxylase family protein [Flavobacteriales bacterium]